MAHEGVEGTGDALARAEATIAAQAREIEELRAELADESFARDLKEALAVAEVTAVLGSPVSHDELLRLILEAAAEVTGAESAVLLLLDQEGDELVFDVTLGVDVDEVKSLRLPLGHGVAGLVAASGQPMAVSSAGSDSSFAPELEEALSYAPRSVLCVPLRYAERVIGVLEVVDKDGGNAFAERDLERLSLFARQAAVTIMQSRTYRRVDELLGSVLSSLGGAGDGTGPEQAAAFAARLGQDAVHGQTRELTELLHEVSTYGEDELQTCLAIVRDLVTYLRTRPWPDATRAAG